jgi:hypothetical protein
VTQDFARLRAFLPWCASWGVLDGLGHLSEQPPDLIKATPRSIAHRFRVRLKHLCSVHRRLLTPAFAIAHGTGQRDPWLDSVDGGPPGPGSDQQRLESRRRCLSVFPGNHPRMSC